MVLSKKTQTDIEINEALAEMFDRQKINMQGAAAAIAVITQSGHTDDEKTRQLADVEFAVAEDQTWFKSALENLSKRFGSDRVGRVMRTGIDLSEFATH